MWAVSGKGRENASRQQVNISRPTRMRLCILASIFAVRPFAHGSASALLRNVLILSR